MRRLLLLLPLFVPGVAAAQDRPLLQPTRDVEVTYQTAPGGTATEQRTRWLAAEHRMRLDTPAPGLYMIVDYAARRMSMVSDRDRGVVDMAAGAGPLPGGAGGAPGGAYARRGTDRVAGLPCTEWQTTDSEGAATLACITDDGVMLRARRGTEVLVQAARVRYGPQDPAAFRVPDGYRRVQR